MSKKGEESSIESASNTLLNIVKITAAAGVIFLGYEAYQIGSDFFNNPGKHIKTAASKYFGFDRSNPCEEPAWYTYLSFIGAGKNLKDYYACQKQQEIEKKNLSKAADYLNEDSTQAEVDATIDTVATETGSDDQPLVALAAAIRIELKRYEETGNIENLRRAKELLDGLTDAQVASVVANDPDFFQVMTHVRDLIERSMNTFQKGLNEGLFGKLSNQNNWDENDNYNPQ